MKNLTVIFVVLLFSGIQMSGQNIEPNRLQGCWKGDLILPGNSSIPVGMNFKVSNNTIEGTYDLPMQKMIDLPIDTVTLTRDSIFADHTSTIGDEAFYEGLLLPGDSVIDGKWIQGSASLPLKLKLSSRLYMPLINKSNLNPEIEGYKIIKLIESTPVKDQKYTNICWDFTVTSFIETEAIRLGKNPIVLSPMFYIVPTYIEKADKFIRLNGKSYFGPGDLTFSALKAYRNYGAIPEEVYTGKIDNSKDFNHSKMDKKLLDKVNYDVKAGRDQMTMEEYINGVREILTGTLGKAPDTFMYHQKRYTPKSFAKEKIGINPDDYVEITSYTHHPFYSKCYLEIEGNWNNNQYLNLPINDFINVVDYALLHNYSVCWDGDIHHGYDNGFATLEDPKTITQQVRQGGF